MESKACTKCGAVKPLSEFYFINNEKTKSECKSCSLIYKKKYYSKNSEKIKKANAEWDLKNKEKSDKRKKRYTIVSIDKYIITQLVKQGFTNDQITPELIELKKEQLEIHRLSKQLKEAIKNGN